MRPVLNIEIPAELRAALDAVPDRKIGSKLRKWTEAEDAALLEYWPLKNHTLLAKAIGVSEKTALNRYRELTRE